MLWMQAACLSMVLKAIAAVLTACGRDLSSNRLSGTVPREWSALTSLNNMWVLCADRLTSGGLQDWQIMALCWLAT